MNTRVDIPVLETERLRLRGWREEDHAPFARFCASEATARFVGGVCGPDDAWRRIAGQIGHWALRGYGSWVIEEKDREHSIYEVPLSLHQNKLDELIVERLALANAGPPQLDDWRAMLQRVIHPAQDVTVAFVGKYVKHRDAYKSVYEALDHAGIAHHAKVKVQRIESEVDAEVRDLKTGYDAIEERARSELGMIRQDEVFYQVLEPGPKP